MKTEALIDMLARDAGPVPSALAARRLSPAAAAGLLVSALIAITWFGIIPAQMFATAVPICVPVGLVSTKSGTPMSARPALTYWTLKMSVRSGRSVVGPPIVTSTSAGESSSSTVMPSASSAVVPPLIARTS